MSCPSWIARGGLVVGMLGLIPAHARATAEVKVDRDFLTSVVEKLPPCPFEKAGQYRGQVEGFRLLAIDPKARQIVVACRIVGEFDEAAVVAGLGKSNKATAPAQPNGKWKTFRFDARVSINIEPNFDGTPRFRLEVDEVKRRELEGLAGTLAKLMGKHFDAIVTQVADKKANGLNDKLNAEITKKIALFKDYGLLCGIDYFPTQIVLLFDQTRLRSEGIEAYVFSTPEPGTVPLYRWINPRRGEHFYSTNPNGADLRVFRAEGIACHVFDHPAPGTVPLYRWRARRECLYTSTPDPAALRRLAFHPDGIACYVFNDPKANAVPFYRFTDPRSTLHFYTTHPHAEFAK
jgi:hypothetical protein